MNIYYLLDKLNIDYEEISHKPVYTIEEAIKEDISSKIKGIGCKSLFVKNKNSYYLILIEENKRANLKEIAKLINEKKLSFASSDELKEILKLSPGGVTPLGIINDENNIVKLLLDKDLQGHKILVHPEVNTKTISIEYKDLLKLIDFTKHKYYIF
ncbi:MAG: prolyl-tRNA synthetase associated domain-containing protein [Peptoniphilaceae bacterium]